MKKTILFSVSLVFTLFIGAQAEVLNIDGTLINPVGIKVINNDLYIGEVGDQALSRVDLSQPDPKPISQIGTDLSGIADIIIDGNFLYFGAVNDGGSIYRMDIADSSNTITQIISNVGNIPFGLVIQNNYLYASLREVNKIIRIDLNQATLSATDFVTNIPGTFVNDIEIYQNHLYFLATSSENMVARVNLSQSNPTIETVIDNIPNPTGLALYQNKLLIATPVDNLVGMINLDDPSPVFETLVTVDDPWDLSIQNNMLYISQQGPDTISFFDLSGLSVSNDLSIAPIEIYPNPTSDLIKISNLTESVKYSITDVTGKTILSNTLELDGSIDVRSLSQGMYILRLDGYSNSYKIVKK